MLRRPPGASGVWFLNSDGGAFVELTSKRHAAAPSPGRCDAQNNRGREGPHRSARSSASLWFLVPLQVLDVGGLQVLSSYLEQFLHDNHCLTSSPMLKVKLLPTATESGFPVYLSAVS